MASRTAVPPVRRGALVGWWADVHAVDLPAAALELAHHVRVDLRELRFRDEAAGDRALVRRDDDSEARAVEELDRGCGALEQDEVRFRPHPVRLGGERPVAVEEHRRTEVLRLHCGVARWRRTNTRPGFRFASNFTGTESFRFSQSGKRQDPRSSDMSFQSVTSWSISGSSESRAGA